MSKLIARAFSDLHVHKFQAFNKDNSRLEWTLKAMNKILSTDVPILFCGDLINNPKEIENETLFQLMAFLKEADMKKVQIYAISGNHDQCQISSMENYSPSYIQTMSEVFENFHCIDNSYTDLIPGYNIAGIPYYTNEEDFLLALKEFKPNPKTFNILLGHSDIPGAQLPDGSVLDSVKGFPKNLNKVFKDWSLCLFGHIHKPQQLFSTGYMLGSPIHQTAGDCGLDMGYWDIYSDCSVRFRPLVGFPQFKRLKKGEEPYNSLDYFIKPDEDVEEEELEKGEYDLDTNSRSELAKKYLRVKGIKSKAKKKALINVLNYSE